MFILAIKISGWHLQTRKQQAHTGPTWTRQKDTQAYTTFSTVLYNFLLLRNYSPDAALVYAVTYFYTMYSHHSQSDRSWPYLTPSFIVLRILA